MVSGSEIVKTSRELNSLLIDALRGLRGADACTVFLTERSRQGLRARKEIHGDSSVIAAFKQAWLESLKAWPCAACVRKQTLNSFAEQ